MPRVRKIQPTLIYWLFDTRPETLVEWLNGYPFYCGKTVLTLSERLSAHRSSARRCQNRPVAQKINECGEHIRIQVMAVASSHENWAEQERIWIDLEKFWIRSLRLLWDGATNVADGGSSMAGLIRSTETRARMSESNRRRKGIKFSDSGRANMSAARKGKKRAPFSNEHRANLSKAAQNRSDELNAAIGLRTKGKKLSPEHRAAVSAGLRGKKRGPYSAEHRAKISAAQKGKPGRKHSLETRAKMSAVHLARNANAPSL